MLLSWDRSLPGGHAGASRHTGRRRLTFRFAERIDKGVIMAVCE
jgi:hypothetical protein